MIASRLDEALSFSEEMVRSLSLPDSSHEIQPYLHVGRHIPSKRWIIQRTYCAVGILLSSDLLCQPCELKTCQRSWRKISGMRSFRLKPALAASVAIPQPNNEPSNSVSKVASFVEITKQEKIISRWQGTSSFDVVC